MTESVDQSVDLDNIWSQVLTNVADADLPRHQHAFLDLTHAIAVVGDTVLLAAPNELTKEVLETKLRDVVVNALSQALGHEVRLAVTVEAESETPTDNGASTTNGEPTQDAVID